LGQKPHTAGQFRTREDDGIIIDDHGYRSIARLRTVVIEFDSVEIHRFVLARFHQAPAGIGEAY
jgi:hypothetical protein